MGSLCTTLSRKVILFSLSASMLNLMDGCQLLRLEQVISHETISYDKGFVYAAFPNSWSVAKELEHLSFKDFHVKVGDDSGNWTSHASTFLLFTERSFIPEAHVPQNDVQEFGDQ